MSSSLETFCEFCKEYGNFTLIVDCDYQVCEKHLLEQKVDPVTNKMKCLICQEDFDLEQYKKTTNNQLRLLTREFETKHQELLKRLEEYSLYKDDLESIKNQNFQQLKNSIEMRKKELEIKIQEALNREYNHILDKLEIIKDIYMNEIGAGLAEINIDETSKNFQQISHDLHTKNVPPKQKIKILESNIESIKKKYDELQTVKISMEKSKNVEFKKLHSDLKFDHFFGTLNYKSGMLKNFDRIDITSKMTLESVFGFVDYSGTVIPELKNLKSTTPATLKGHCAKITKIDQLPNGDLISSSDDCTIKIWNMKTGLCSNTLAGHSNSIKSFKLLGPSELVSVSAVEKKSPTSSRQSIRSSYTNAELSAIIIWDLHTGVPKHFIQGHKATLHTVDVLDENTLVTGDAEGNINFWSVSSGNALKTIKAHDQAIYSVIVLNNETIVSGSADNKIKIWTLVQGDWKQKDEDLDEHSSYVWYLVKVNDKQFLSGANDYDIKLWDVNEKKSLHTFVGHSDTIRSIKLLENGKFLSASADGTIILWDLKSGNIDNELALGQVVQTINLSSKSDLIVACKDEFTIQVYKSAKSS